MNIGIIGMVPSFVWDMISILELAVEDITTTS
jgi:hypothetical protein